jgi:hypothetical protein
MRATNFCQFMPEGSEADRTREENCQSQILSSRKSRVRLIFQHDADMIFFFLFLCRGGFPRALRPVCGLLYIPYRHSTSCQGHTGAPVRSTGEPRYLLLTGVPGTNSMVSVLATTVGGKQPNQFCSVTPFGSMRFFYVQ